MLLSTLNCKLKVGAICGALGTSGLAGTVATYKQSDLISSSLSTLLDPVSTFASSSVLPVLTKVSNGAFSIAKVYGGWGNDLKNNSIWGKIQNQSLSNVSSGFNALVAEWTKWYQAIFGSVSDVSSWITGISEFLNREEIAKYLLLISEYSETIFSFLTVMMSSVFMFAQNSITPSSMAPEGQSQESSGQATEAITKALGSGNFMKLAGGIWDVVKDNSGQVKNLNVDQVKTVLFSALKDIEKFSKRVETLKSSNSDQKSGRWGKYNSPQQLVNDLTETTWFRVAVRWFDMFLRGVSECNSGQTCDPDDSLIDAYRLFASVLKGVETGKKKEK